MEKEYWFTILRGIKDSTILLEYIGLTLKHSGRTSYT